MKIDKLRRIFSNKVAQKVPIQVADEFVEFTDTQVDRLQELADRRRVEPPPERSNSLEKARYSLEESAFRLLVSEDEILRRAAAEKVDVYVDVAGKTGYWQCKSPKGEARQSTEQSLASGYLALSTNACRELLENDGVSANRFELRRPADFDALQLEDTIVNALAAWGRGKKIFCMQEPLWVARQDLILMAPLAVLT